MPASQSLEPLWPGSVTLLPGGLSHRRTINRRYMMSLKEENLLQNHYMEAMLWNPTGKPEDAHWGCESPTAVVRGHFLGHWLSAAARLTAATGDLALKGKADWIVSELGRCQEANGGEWLASIPEKYLHWVAEGRQLWAAQYIVHKTLMGLYDMFAFTQNEQALDLLVKAARWFHRWTNNFPTEQMDDILDQETGGMLEVWSDLFAVTKQEEHLDLIHRYDRRRLFDRLLAGEDVLTNRHANTTIPEAQGAARAWEVTGEQRYRDVVDAYWDWAVTRRGFFCTGGQNSHELWTPPFEFSARLAANQEHCTVYNMMRLAEYLFRWTGDPRYADYWERNLHNGVLAQQHPQTGMVSYFLPLGSGSKKKWGTPTDDFWCCHGTLLQANAQHGTAMYYQRGDNLVVAQYFPSEVKWHRNGTEVVLRQETVVSPGGVNAAPQSRKKVEHPIVVHRPQAQQIVMTVECDHPTEFGLDLRIPWWVSDEVAVRVDGEPQQINSDPSSFLRIDRAWSRSRIEIDLPRKLVASALPDEPSTVAFMEGPVVLAGLCDEERILRGDPDDPSTVLKPDFELQFAWRTGYRTHGVDRGIKFVPLNQITDETYSVYFPIEAT